MLKTSFLLAVVISLITSLLISAVHVRPIDHSDFNALFGITPDCQIDCWQGLRINQTTRAEARRILEAHPWVSRIYESNLHLSWRWSGAQPALINAQQDGLIRFGGGVIRQLRLQTNMTFGDVWLVMQQPDDVLLVRAMSRYSAYQIARYEAEGVQIISSLRCPAMSPEAFWRATTTIGMGEIWSTEALNGSRFDIYEQPGWWHSLRGCRARPR